MSSLHSGFGTVFNVKAPQRTSLPFVCINQNEHNIYKNKDWQHFTAAILSTPPPRCSRDSTHYKKINYKKACTAPQQGLGSTQTTRKPRTTREKKTGNSHAGHLYEKRATPLLLQIPKKKKNHINPYQRERLNTQRRHGQHRQDDTPPQTY